MNIDITLNIIKKLFKKSYINQIKNSWIENLIETSHNNKKDANYNALIDKFKNQNKLINILEINHQTDSIYNTQLVYFLCKEKYLNNIVDTNENKFNYNINHAQNLHNDVKQILYNSNNIDTKTNILNYEFKKNIENNKCYIFKIIKVINCAIKPVCKNDSKGINEDEDYIANENDLLYDENGLSTETNEEVLNKKNNFYNYNKEKDKRILHFYLAYDDKNDSLVEAFEYKKSKQIDEFENYMKSSHKNFSYENYSFEYNKIIIGPEIEIKCGIICLDDNNFKLLY